jgi:methyl-accepting chemotaxis protein
MEQIASGADEAGGAAQEQLAAIKRIFASFRTARSDAESSRRQTENFQTLLADAARQIQASVRAIERNALRQNAVTEIIIELESRAKDIGEITDSVSRISDQTNLLALNAAIEAARAGDEGRGFAVVADEVRALAETSDKNAQEVKRLADDIQNDVRGVAAAMKSAAETAVTEARQAVAVEEVLNSCREDMRRIAEGSEAMLAAAREAESAASEIQKGAEQVASAAEESAAGAAEAQLAVQQQSGALEQGLSAARALASLAEQLRSRSAAGSAVEEIGASAEQLSATIQELTGAAAQIMAAIEQISLGSQQQATATQQTLAALVQVESSAKFARNNGEHANERVVKMESAIMASRASVERLMAGVSAAIKVTQPSFAIIVRLETVGRRIEKIINASALISVQTNMLAVSGSVEAARTGGAGRGFALVSNDIRSLAREASQNIERAKDTVRNILDQIATLKRDLEYIVTTTEIEVQNNQAISIILEKLGMDLASLTTVNRTILEGAQSILLSAAETAEGARQIAAAAEESSNASRQAATASSEQARGAEDLAAAIEEIASLADALKKQIKNG